MDHKVTVVYQLPAKLVANFAGKMAQACSPFCASVASIEDQGHYDWCENIDFSGDRDHVVCERIRFKYVRMRANVKFSDTVEDFLVSGDRKCTV